MPPNRLRLARIGVLSMLAALALPGVALAQGGQINLALQAVGQPGSFFDETMRPGESRVLDVVIANNGAEALAVRTYAADVFTIVNGGFGGDLRDQPASGTTLWLDYPTTVLVLSAGASLHRSLVVSVPLDASPGEYISSILLENDRPIEGGGSVGLNQIVRQAIAVVISVPGRRVPGLSIGAASHEVVAGRSVVAVDVANTGNVRLKPIADFALFDASGAEVSHATVPMDTFYSRTDSFIEVPLAALLRPGIYTVRLALEDVDQGAEASEPAIPLVVEAPAAGASGDVAAPGRTAVTQGPPDGALLIPAWLVLCLVGAGVIGSAIIGSAVFLQRRRARISSR